MSPSGLWQRFAKPPSVNPARAGSNPATSASWEATKVRSPRGRVEKARIASPDAMRDYYFVEYDMTDISDPKGSFPLR